MLMITITRAVPEKYAGIASGPKAVEITMIGVWKNVVDVMGSAGIVSTTGATAGAGAGQNGKVSRCRNLTEEIRYGGGRERGR